MLAELIRAVHVRSLNKLAFCERIVGMTAVRQCLDLRCLARGCEAATRRGVAGKFLINANELRY